ncbi:hypothetical protein QCA50_005005 [Cerrena zonata]|uniref:DEAD/DEAH-box helicase domain-containing protein n=1 Tax=Cerrena zonata TaxID=2478898 RepID=A0AAW0GQ17_9APHY
MSSADLFSFLDDAPEDADLEESYDDAQMNTEDHNEDHNEHDDETKKRKVELTETVAEPGPSTHKKQRMDSPKPAVLDEVEIEAKREVPAVAGLQASAGEAGASLELRHQALAVPAGYPYTPISQHVPPAKPVREYPFTLDPFQQVSVYAIQRNESVLVSAHTSAGKTVVAEYAIAQCLQNKQRVIYTSPIKACS